MRTVPRPSAGPPDPPVVLRRTDEPRPDPDRAAGFTLVEVVVVLTIVAALVGMLVPLGAELLESQRGDAAREQLTNLREAVVGEAPLSNQRPAASVRGGRVETDPTTFGFNGDLGQLPDSLPQLLRADGFSSYSVDQPTGIGVGWRGPYLGTGAESAGDEEFLDPFGRSIRYVLKDTVVDGTQAVGYLRSVGPDRTEGTDDDLLAPLLETDVRSGVTGFVYHASGQPVVGAPVTYTFRGDGTLQDTVVRTDTAGQYEVAPHSLGPVRARSGASGAEALAYVKNSAAAVSDSLNDLRFRIVSVQGDPVTLTSLTLNAATLGGSTVAGCPTGLVINGIDVKPTTDRVCPGETISFTRGITIRGGTSFASSIGSRKFLVLGADQTAPELRIGGGTERGEASVLLADWEETNGDAFNIRGVDVTLTVSDGSTFTFTIP